MLEIVNTIGQGAIIISRYSVTIVGLLSVHDLFTRCGVWLDKVTVSVISAACLCGFYSIYVWR